MFFAQGQVTWQLRCRVHQCICWCMQSFYARKQLCFQRVLAIAILSVRLSVRHTGGSGKNSPS